MSDDDHRLDVTGRLPLGALLAAAAFGLAHTPFWGLGPALAASLPFGVPHGRCLHLETRRVRNRNRSYRFAAHRAPWGLRSWKVSISRAGYCDPPDCPWKARTALMRTYPRRRP